MIEERSTSNWGSKPKPPGLKKFSFFQIIKRCFRAILPLWSYEGLKIALGKELPYHIEIKCPIEMHGTIYGGWCIVRDGITSDSIIYSLGIGEELSFDQSLIRQYGVKVHAFDPTPEALAWAKKQKLPGSLIIHEFGVAGQDGFVNLYAPAKPGMISHTIRPVHRHAPDTRSIIIPVQRMSTIMHKLGHDHIDILKMDIEGAEYEVIDEIVKKNILIKQVLVEFHHFLRGMPMAQTRCALEKLRKMGYRIFYIDPLKHEFSLIRNYRRPVALPVRG